jgi:hypothetical protein
MATAEKAAFDMFYLARARGQRFSHLTEIQLPHRDSAARRLPIRGARRLGDEDRRVRSFVERQIAELLLDARRSSTS